MKGCICEMPGSVFEIFTQFGRQYCQACGDALVSVPPSIDPTGAYKGLFPEDSAERKTFPVYSGLLQYFPSALAAIAHHSYLGNEKHNPGQPLNHDRAKSGDEPDALVRHLMEGDLVGMAWRALSMLQKDCEAKGAPIAPAARNAKPWEQEVAAFRSTYTPGYSLSDDAE